MLFILIVLLIFLVFFVGFPFPPLNVSGCGFNLCLTMVVALNFVRVVVSSEHILEAKDPLPRKIHTCAFMLKILPTTWVYGLRSKKFFCHSFSLVILSSCFPAFPIMLMIPQTVSST